MHIPVTSPVALSPPDLGLPTTFASFRPHQYETALSLLNTKRRFSLLSAPTGIGKSLILMTYATLHGGRILYLVGTRGLQAQLSDFADISRVIQGKRNYPCDLLGHDHNCADGPCNLGDYCHLRKAGCHYYDAVTRAQGASIVISNYAQWFSMSKHGNPDALGTFDAILCDEAHGVLDWLTTYSRVTITEHDIQHLLGLNYKVPREVDSDDMSWVPWAGELYTVARDRYTLAKEQGVDRDTLLRLITLGRNLATLASAKPEYKWVCERSHEPSLGLSFTPVWPRYLAEKLLYRGVPRVVMASATLHDVITRYLSIPPLECHTVTLPSPFDPRRRPFYILPVCKVDQGMTDSDKLRLWTTCDDIIATRQHVRTVIHTHSYARARDYIAATRHKGIVVTHRSSRDLEDRLRVFYATPPPCVFVSPSVAEGRNFAYGKAQCQILLKVPFLVPNTLTKARRKDDRAYGNYVPALTIEQQYGRLMRAEDDCGETFMLDRHFSDHFHRQPYFQQWFRDAWRWVAQIPEPLTL